MNWELDHLAVAAETLEEGADWVEGRLGVRPGAGGHHPTMGTHNLLLWLGRRLYLEVIAIDPAAAAPGRARWFGLDGFSGPPRLAAWVVRVPDLAAALAAAPEGTGEVLPFARGAYRWRMAVPRNGLLPFDGCAPALITWQGASHPAEALPPSGVQLLALTVSHPEPLARHLPPVANVDYVTGAPGLTTVLDTPDGERRL